MSDPTGTARTPWAATLTDERVSTGDSRDGAIRNAYDDLSNRWHCGQADAGDYVLTVYEDVLWCTGSDDYEDCYCGGGHEDYDGPWLLLSWGSRRRYPAELVEVVGADGEPSDPLISHTEDDEVTP